MRRWVAVLLVVMAVGLLLQLLLFLREGPPSWLVLATRGRLQLNASSHPNSHSPTYTPLHDITPRGDGVTLRKNAVVSTTDRHAHHPYHFRLNEPAACNNHTELVMVVITAPSNTVDRLAVRETWGSCSKDPHIARIFLLGATSNETLQAALVQESRHYRDMVQEDFVDSYRNLSLKSVAMLKWVTMFCNSSRFVLKADDDMYINVTNLLSAMRKEALSHATFVLGYVFTGAKPEQNRNSKWYTPMEQFNEKVYPRYTSGTAYCMTTSAAEELYAASVHVPLFWLEDIYITGLCSRKAGVPVYHHGGFSYVKTEVDGCYFSKAISAHMYSAEEKRAIFQKVNDPNLKCT